MATKTKAELQAEMKIKDANLAKRDEELNYLRAAVAEAEAELREVYDKAKKIYYGSSAGAGIIGLIVGTVLGALLF